MSTTRRKVRGRQQPQNFRSKGSLTQPEERKQSASHLRSPELFRGLIQFTPLFPVQTRKRLMYFEPAIQVLTTGGLYGQYVFSANGLYDPDITSTGHQPIGWDQLMLYYEQATVVASRITVRALNNGAQGAVIGVALSPDTTTLDPITFIENGQCTSELVDGRGTNGTGERIKHLNLSCDVARYFGRPDKRNIVNDVTLSSTAASNPTEQVYFIIGVWGVGLLGDNLAFQLDVCLEYDAIFWEPRKAAASLERRDTRSVSYQQQKQTNINMKRLLQTCDGDDVGVRNGLGRTAGVLPNVPPVLSRSGTFRDSVFTSRTVPSD